MSQDELWDDAFKYKLLGFLKTWDLSEKQLGVIEKCIDMCISKKIEEIKSKAALIDQMQDTKIEAIKKDMQDKAKDSQKLTNLLLTLMGLAIAAIGVLK